MCRKRKRAEYCVESTVSEKKTKPEPHWVFGANSASSARNSVNSLCHTNNGLRGTHWILSRNLVRAKNSLSSVFETVLSDTVFGPSPTQERRGKKGIGHFPPPYVRDIFGPFFVRNFVTEKKPFILEPISFCRGAIQNVFKIARYNTICLDIFQAFFLPVWPLLCWVGNSVPCMPVKTLAPYESIPQVQNYYRIGHNLNQWAKEGQNVNFPNFKVKNDPKTHTHTWCGFSMFCLLSHLCFLLP